MHVCILSANHPYLQPEGWIAKGAAQQDQPNACERRLWQPPNGHEWTRGTAAKPDVFYLGKGQTNVFIIKFPKSDLSKFFHSFHTSHLLWNFSASSFACFKLFAVSSRIICVLSNSNCFTFISFCRSECLLSEVSCNCRNLCRSNNDLFGNFFKIPIKF